MLYWSGVNLTDATRTFVGICFVVCCSSAVRVLFSIRSAYCSASPRRVKPSSVDSWLMAQFGPGSALAAQCPRVPPPDGWRAWLPDADGPIPDALAERVQALIDDQGAPLGATESYPLPGVTTLVRLEPRVWGRDVQGTLVQGCFRSVGIYLPAGTPPAASGAAPSSDKLAKTIGVLTVMSLAVGTVATLANWSK